MTKSQHVAVANLKGDCCVRVRCGVLNMGRLEDAKRAWDAARAANDSEAMEKASSTWKSVAEAEKTELESQQIKSSAHSESAKVWLPSIAAVISAVALAAGLVFQAYQLKENVRIQADSAEDTAYREAVKDISDYDTLRGGVVGGSQMKTFLNSPRYGPQAREIVKSLLGGVVRYETFQSLFTAVAAKTDASNVQDIIQIQNSVFNSYRQIDSDINTASSQRSAQSVPQFVPGRNGIGPPISPGMFANAEPMIENGSGRRIPVSVAKDMESSIGDEFGLCTTAIINIIKTRATSSTIDLTGAKLYDTDLSTLSFAGALVDSVDFSGANVQRADFSSVKSFNGSDWTNVAWWKADKLSPGLLAYLKKNYPYSKYQHHSKANDQEYLNSLSRLQSATSA